MSRKHFWLFRHLLRKMILPFAVEKLENDIELQTRKIEGTDESIPIIEALLGEQVAIVVANVVSRVSMKVGNPNVVCIPLGLDAIDAGIAK